MFLIHAVGVPPCGGECCSVDAWMFYLVRSSFVCAVAAVEVEDLKMRLLLLEVKSFWSHCWVVPVTFGNTQLLTPKLVAVASLNLSCASLTQYGSLVILLLIYCTQRTCSR